jgi:hypothetical protein
MHRRWLDGTAFRLGKMAADSIELPGSCRGAAGELPGSCRGAAGELPGSCRGAAGELAGRRYFGCDMSAGRSPPERDD